MFTIPDNWHSQVGIKVDSTGVITEKNENNNIAFARLERSDLKISAVVADQNLRKIKFSVKNDKFPSVEIRTLFKIKFWDPKNTSHRKELSISPQDINKQNGFNGFFIVPDSWNSQVGINVDSTGVIEESNENNNITFVMLAKPDLIVYAKSENKRARKISYVVKNIEYKNAKILKAFNLTVWDTLNSINRVSIKISIEDANNPNGYSNYINISRSWSSHIGFRVDSSGIIEEKNENNNFTYIHF